MYKFKTGNVVSVAPMIVSMLNLRHESILTGSVLGEPEITAGTHRWVPVQFEFEDERFHSCRGKGMPNRCYYILEEDLTLVKDCITGNVSLREDNFWTD